MAESTPVKYEDLAGELKKKHDKIKTVLGAGLIGSFKKTPLPMPGALTASEAPGSPACTVGMAENMYPGRPQPGHLFNIHMVELGYRPGKGNDEGSCSHSKDKGGAGPRDRPRHCYEVLVMIKMEADSSDRTVLSAPPALPFGVDLTGDGKLGYGFTSADELEEVDIGPGDKPRPTFISKKLDPQLRSQMIALLKEYPYCFAWDYTEMPGLDRSIIEHRLPLKKGFQPFQKRARQMRAEILEEVKKEIEKMLAAGFIRPCRYAEWISSIVPVEKKDGRWRMAIDFRDLNRATPKDEYPMPVAETLINAAAGHKVLSFMDGNAGYNQIFMAPEDIHKTAFRVPGAFRPQDKPFYIYLSVADTSIASVVVQLYEGVERVVFYLSRRMLDAETRYPEVEKRASAVLYLHQAASHPVDGRDLRHMQVGCCQAHAVGPVLKGRLGKWMFALSSISGISLRKQSKGKRWPIS
ncbi:hypothetical protein QYE76_048682 [Lolium multiflorum]|uniref:Reverse transcriptase/retrotransposon-derived protein RNase H-like domain-containing protein n=1 Tax=Lolium multiflorum TaxID=4521 RepID=A0AAD8SLH2_LOLMU|nr:hypothetical protein QYE76_048682 [Lolium multiflorum]